MNGHGGGSDGNGNTDGEPGDGDTADDGEPADEQMVPAGLNISFHAGSAAAVVLAKTTLLVAASPAIAAGFSLAASVWRIAGQSPGRAGRRWLIDVMSMYVGI